MVAYLMRPAIHGCALGKGTEASSTTTAPTIILHAVGHTNLAAQALGIASCHPILPMSMIYVAIPQLLVFICTLVGRQLHLEVWRGEACA